MFVGSWDVPDLTKEALNKSIGQLLKCRFVGENINKVGWYLPEDGEFPDDFKYKGLTYGIDHDPVYMKLREYSEIKVVRPSFCFVKPTLTNGRAVPELHRLDEFDCNMNSFFGYAILGGGDIYYVVHNDCYGAFVCPEEEQSFGRIDYSVNDKYTMYNKDQESDAWTIQYLPLLEHNKYCGIYLNTNISILQMYKISDKPTNENLIKVRLEGISDKEIEYYNKNNKPEKFSNLESFRNKFMGFIDKDTIISGLTHEGNHMELMISYLLREENSPLGITEALFKDYINYYKEIERYYIKNGLTLRNLRNSRDTHIEHFIGVI